MSSRVDIESTDDLTTRERLDRFAYALFGRFYRNKSEYSALNRHLKQSRMGVPVDVYLSRALFYSITVAVVGVAIGLLLGIAFWEFFAGIETDVTTSNEFVILFIEFSKANASIIVPFIMSVVIGLTLLFISERAFMWYPKNVAGDRGRDINGNLSRAILFLYSVSKGGTNIITSFKALADAEGYGEVSEEFSAIVRLIEFQNEDIITALQQVAINTPSDEFQEFLEDMITTIESGADLESFLEQQEEKTREAAMNDQEENLEFLELIGEMYLMIPAVAGLMVFIFAVAIGITGGDLLTETAFYIYLATPLITIIFAVIVNTITREKSEQIKTLQTDITLTKPDYKTLFDSNTDSRLIRVIESIVFNILFGIESSKVKYEQLKRLLFENPLYTIAFTLPMSIGTIHYFNISEVAQLSVDGFLASPLWNTVVYVAIPLYIILIPIILLYEVEARRRRKVMNRLPEILRTTSETNKRGIKFEDTLKLVGKNSDGYVANEIEKSYNNITWTGDVHQSLVRLANTLRVPRLTKTVTLITKAYQISGDVSNVLDTAAKDVEAQAKIDAKQKQGGQQTMVIILLIFFISLGVILAIQSEFIAVFESVMNEAGEDGLEEVGFGGGFDPEMLRLLALHFPAMLGVTAGLLIGALGNGRVESGLKYSIGLFTITLIAFALI